MREDLAAVVYPVIAHALRLRNRLLRGEQPNIDQEQRELLKLLRTEVEARRWPDYGGAGERYGGTFWGSRYALACWLDEVFLNEEIRSTPWGIAWNDKKMEVQLYNSNERAWMFWNQAKLASAAGPDALEVFYLCVMLGFRGEGEDKPADLEAWREELEGRIERAPEEQAGLKVEFNALPRRGRDRLRGMLLTIVAVLAVLIPAAGYFLIKTLGTQ
jgi:type VI secretion system protein ImpK